MPYHQTATKPRASGLSCQCSTTRQPPACTICNAQVVLNATVTHLATAGFSTFPCFANNRQQTAFLQHYLLQECSKDKFVQASCEYLEPLCFVLGMSLYLVLGSVDLVDSDVPVGLDAWWIKHPQEKPVV